MNVACDENPDRAASNERIRIEAKRETLEHVYESYTGDEEWPAGGFSVWLKREMEAT
jgi:hypothetical protein